jgi:hypothetical protein
MSPVRRFPTYSLFVGLGVLGLLAWSVASFVDDGRDYCEIGHSADLGWWPPRYTCTYSFAGGTTRTVTDAQWDVLAGPAAVLVLFLVTGSWILLLRWKPALAWIGAAIIWVGFTLMVFPFAWAQAAEDFCSLRGRSSGGPSDDFFPPTFTCEFLRTDGSTFTRDYHSTPWVVVIGAAIFGLVGVIGFSLAAWRGVAPFAERRQRVSTPGADAGRPG